MTPERFSVRLEKPQHVFSAAHFITFAGRVCEPLHGHNYRVALEAEGPLDQNHYVLDFVALDRLLSQILADLDHHMLLPTGHPEIQVHAGRDEVEVTFDRRRWVFPATECAVLPMPNTTAELLARYIGRRLLDALRQEGHPSPAVLRIAVDENTGQWGVCELQS